MGQRQTMLVLLFVLDLSALFVGIKLTLTLTLVSQWLPRPVPARCCTQPPPRPRIPRWRPPRAGRTGSCTPGGLWAAWTCPASSGWSWNHLRSHGTRRSSAGDRGRRPAKDKTWRGDGMDFICLVFKVCVQCEFRPAMLMEDTKAAARARLWGRLEGVRPPPIRTRPPTAVRPEDHRHRRKRLILLHSRPSSGTLTT